MMTIDQSARTLERDPADPLSRADAPAERDDASQGSETARLLAANIVDTVREPLIVLDQDLRIVSVNRPFCRSFNATPATVEGQPLWELRCGQWQDAELRERLQSVVREDAIVEEFKIEHEIAGIGRRVVLLNGRKISHQADGAELILLSVTDITARDETEVHLRHVHKIDAIGALAGGIAHDFNNILGSIIGYADMTLDDVREGSLAHTNVERILEAGQRGKQLVEQILTFSRPGGKDFEPIALDQIIEDAHRLLRPILPATIEFRTQILVDSAQVYANASQILQVVTNLCTNAGQAIGNNHGRIVVGLDELLVDEAFAAAHPPLQPGHHLKLSVADNGPGMDEATLGRVFEPFFTTKPVGEGTGMGLAVAHGIVTELNGAMTVHSEVGNGAEFVIYLPWHGGANAGNSGLSSDVPADRKVPRILVIDDEEDILAMAKQMLTRLGYAVVATTNGFEALDLFDAAPERYDLILTDQTMPHITGDRIVQEALEIRPDIPIILCSGYSTALTPERAKELGAFDYIMKPYTRAVLDEIVQQALQGTVEQK